METKGLKVTRKIQVMIFFVPELIEDREDDLVKFVERVGNNQLTGCPFASEGSWDSWLTQVYLISKTAIIPMWHACVCVIVNNSSFVPTLPEVSS